MAANDTSPPVTRSKFKAASSSAAMDSNDPATAEAGSSSAVQANTQATTGTGAPPVAQSSSEQQPHVDNNANTNMVDVSPTPGPSSHAKGKGPASRDVSPEVTTYDEATVETMLRDQQEVYADEVAELKTALATAHDHIKRQNELLPSSDIPPAAGNSSTNSQPPPQVLQPRPQESVPPVQTTQPESTPPDASMTQVLGLLKDMKTHFEAQLSDLRKANANMASSSRKRPLEDPISAPAQRPRHEHGTSASSSSAQSSAAASVSTAPTTASAPPSGPQPASTDAISIPGLSPDASKAALRLMNDPSHPAFELTPAEVSKARMKARPDGPQPKSKLSTSDVKEYRHWAFTLQLRCEQNWAYYLTDSEKIAYAFTWLDGELFTSLDAWRQDCNAGSRTYNAFLKEVQSYTGFDYQQIDAKSALDEAYQLPTKSVAQYYSRLHALWSLAATPKDERVSKFCSTIHNSLHFALMQPFSSVKEMRDKAIEVERYRKARALECLRIPNLSTKDTRPDRSNGQFGSQKASFRNGDRRNAVSQDVQMPTAADKAFNKRFGSCVEKPLTWSGLCGDACCPYAVRKTGNSAGASDGKNFSSMPTAPTAPATAEQPALVSDPE
ncbi:hypothetical protein KEM56_000854 [Ascosphaera pollenicola]|nr:hypothetical protein KEM56_000854 [Ascosphaera pollenicola]